MDHSNTLHPLQLVARGIKSNLMDLTTLPFDGISESSENNNVE